MQIKNTSFLEYKVNYFCEIVINYLFVFLVLARTYMSDYNWKSGVITDAELVFNLFCIYFDRRLTPDPRFLDGKVFRGNYVVKQTQLTSKEKFRSNRNYVMGIFRHSSISNSYICLSRKTTDL